MAETQGLTIANALVFLFALSRLSRELAESNPITICSLREWSCNQGNQCIPLEWKCDGENDCADFSDELWCENITCPHKHWRCDSGKCIKMSWRCDGQSDCLDSSDETGCDDVKCNNQQWMCAGGQCIPEKWRCDRENDCGDMSDEIGCKPERNKTACRETEWECQGKCIPNRWLCDGEQDCSDFSDELNCNITVTNTTFNTTTDSNTTFNTTTFSNFTFDTTIVSNLTFDNTTSDNITYNLCGTSRMWPCTIPGRFICIPLGWRCDGYTDCEGGDDELGCENSTTTSATNSMEQNRTICNSSLCGDNSDEVQCENTTSPDNNWRCFSGKCIPMSWRCDEYADCEGGDDELGCQNSTTTTIATNSMEQNRTICNSSIQFSCLNGQCIPYNYACNSKDDCGDNSDEFQCENTTCPDNNWRCDSGKCIKMSWRCDGESDCLDSSDETGCDYYVPRCNNQQWMCAGGQCIPEKWRCDGENDCGDMSDEIGCKPERNKTACIDTEWECQGKCIPNRWLCDGEQDCSDFSDELNCNITVTNTTFNTTTDSNTTFNTTTFGNFTFDTTTVSNLTFDNTTYDNITDNPCGTSRMWPCKIPDRFICIPLGWRCDGYADCEGGDDELGCQNSTTTTSATNSMEQKRTICNSSIQFSCLNGQCIPYNYTCNSKDDCGDNSDEVQCENTTCPDNNWRCDSGKCIKMSWRCDGESDCLDSSDETRCDYYVRRCNNQQWICAGGQCIPEKWRCDGENDCGDMSDETGCKPERNKTACRDTEWECQGKCIPNHWLCDGISNCPDDSDELNCTLIYNQNATNVTLERPNCNSLFEFSCLNGQCVPYSYKCNSIDECGDGSDEKDCENPKSYDPVRHWLCPGTENPPMCVEKSLLCNGEKNCPDGADEMNCPFQECFPASQWRCSGYPMQWIPLEFRCDGHQDCRDNSDEIDCQMLDTNRIVPL